MRIGVIGIKGLPSKGGTERVVEAIVKRLAKRHDITIYCDSRYTPRGTTYDGVKLIRLPTLNGKHTRAFSLFLLSALHALLRGRFDLIHLNAVEASFVLPLLRLRYRVVSTSHGSPTRCRKEKWERYAQFLMELAEYPFLYLSNIATSVSRADADYYQSRYARRVLYIPNGVDGEIRYDLEAGRRELQEWGVAPGEFLLFSAGRLDPAKGCHIAIEAYCRARPPLPLVVVGDMNQVPSYTEKLRSMAAGQQVIFVPFVADKELLFGIVKQCKFLIFPSVNEGMSIMLLEAASLGVPVICSDIPENQGAIQDGALYFQSGDAQSLAGKIKWAFEHPEEMEHLGEQGKKVVLSTLPWDKIANCYDRLFAACFRREAAPQVFWTRESAG